MGGRADGIARERRQRRWEIHTLAVLGRAKKIPPLKTFVDPPKAIKAGGHVVQTPDEIFAMMRRITGTPAPPGFTPT